MCGASKEVPVTMVVARGLRYGVGEVTVAMGIFKKVGALFAEGSSVNECVHCVADGQRITISNIPLELAEKHGIEQTQIFTFEESNYPGRDDILVTHHGRKRIPLRAFAVPGICVELGVTIPLKVVQDGPLAANLEQSRTAA